MVVAFCWSSTSTCCWSSSTASRSGSSLREASDGGGRELVVDVDVLLVVVDGRRGLIAGCVAQPSMCAGDWRPHPRRHGQRRRQCTSPPLPSARRSSHLRAARRPTRSTRSPTLMQFDQWASIATRPGVTCDLMLREEVGKMGARHGDDVDYLTTFTKSTSVTATTTVDVEQRPRLLEIPARTIDCASSSSRATGRPHAHRCFLQLSSPSSFVFVGGRTHSLPSTKNAGAALHRLTTDGGYHYDALTRPSASSRARPSPPSTTSTRSSATSRPTASPSTAATMDGRARDVPVLQTDVATGTTLTSAGAANLAGSATEVSAQTHTRQPSVNLTSPHTPIPSPLSLSLSLSLQIAVDTAARMLPPPAHGDARARLPMANLRRRAYLPQLRARFDRSGGRREDTNPTVATISSPPTDQLQQQRRSLTDRHESGYPTWTYGAPKCPCYPSTVGAPPYNSPIFNGVASAAPLARSGPLLTDGSLSASTSCNDADAGTAVCVCESR